MMKTNDTNLTLDKSTWTQEDYKDMGWHDANIYGMVIESVENDVWATSLSFDIDYIFRWVRPIPPEDHFTFWVAPCTLTFKEYFDLRINLNTEGQVVESLEVADLILKSKTESAKGVFVYDWLIELQQGNIALKSAGFEQVVRKAPVHVKSQTLTMQERGGLSFARKAYNI